ncbi:MAG: hypothetical protein RIE08_01660 [Acidimicrobiales bacterium]
MTKLAERLPGWLAEHGEPGEQLTSWISLGYARDAGAHGKTAMDAYLASRGLDPAAEFTPYERQAFAALTDRRVLLGKLRGFLGNKPAELLRATSLGECRIEWWDEPAPGPDKRYLLFVLGDSWYRTAAVVRKSTNADVFMAAMGPNAVNVPRPRG